MASSETVLVQGARELERRLSALDANSDSELVDREGAQALISPPPAPR